MSNQELYNHICDLFQKSTYVELVLKGEFLHSDFDFLINNFDAFNLCEISIDKNIPYNMDKIKISFRQRCYYEDE